MKKFAFLYVLIFSLFAFTEMLSQGIPETANYQGVLKDASGNIVPDGNYNITFKLYDSVVGGTVLWTEAKVVNIVGGIINTQLGSVVPLNSNLFIGATWLGITIESGSELTPRIALTSAPYSFMTMDVADGRVVKSLNSLKDNINLIAGSNITITPTGNDLTISATGGGGGGTVTQVNTGAGLTGGPITTTGTISVANDGITNEMLQNNTVTSSKIVDGTIASGDLGNNSVTSAKVVDGTLLATDVGSNQLIKSVNSIKDSVNLVAGSNINITPSGHTLTISASGGSGGGDITAVYAGNGLNGGGTVGDVTLEVEPGGITNLMLQDNSVTTTKIQDATITATDLANSSVTNAKLSDNSVTTAKINDGTIVTSDLGDNSVTSSKIVDGTVTTTDLSDNSVTTAKIVDGTIASGDLANNSVTSAKVVDGTITSADIGSTQVLKSLNTLKDDVNLVAGTNITITPSGQNLTISSTSGGIGGSGTINYVPKFTNSTTLGNSALYDNGNRIGINNSSPNFALTINSDPTSGLGLKLSRSTGGFGIALLEDSQPTGLRGWNFDVFNQKLKINTTSDNGYTPTKNLMTFDRNGNIGIGTETPSYPLHVATNRKYSGYFTTDSLSTNAHVVHGEYLGTAGFDAIGVYGKSTPADFYGIGGYFEGGYRGVQAVVYSTGSSTYSGVGSYVNGSGTKYGFISDVSGAGTNYGVLGYAYSGTTNYGVYGYAWGATNWAGYFSGNVNVTGTLSKGGGSFKIDHPLDPANKYLYHSFVESPDMMNIYNGNVVTDGSGFATVTMPDWFEALNKDFRYQLTVIGEFAQAIIAQEVQNNQFAIKTDKPNVKVSWQVTGIRKDAFAEKNRIPVEEMKQGDDAGKYIYPDAFGLPETMGIDYKNNHPDKEKDFK